MPVETVSVPLRVKIDDETAESVYTGGDLVQALGGSERVEQLLNQLGHVYSEEKAKEFQRVQAAIATEEKRRKKSKAPRTQLNIRAGLEKIAEGAAWVGTAAGFTVLCATMSPLFARTLDKYDIDGYDTAKSYGLSSLASAASAVLAATPLFSPTNPTRNVYIEGWFSLSAASMLVGFGTAGFYAIREATKNFIERRRRALRLEHIRQAFCSSEELQA